MLNRRHITFICAALPLLVISAHSVGQQAENSEVIIDIPVVSRRLDTARQQIQPSLGASVYRLSPAAIDAVPQGTEASLQQLLIRAPGVAQDSFGQIHVRGEHGNLQYRLNGVQLPEGLSGFGEAIEARFTNGLSLITGALPAQYGFQTAGVVDIQTKTGITSPGLTVATYGGSWNWLQPSFEYGGSNGAVDWFITGDFLHNDRGIENPTARFGALHDSTNQFHGLGYVSAIIDPETRISLILGGFSGQYQIPNNPGQATLGFAVNGISNFNSAQLRQTQSERTEFAILSLQKHIGDVDLQISAYTRDSWLRYTPDPLGDLLFNGIAQNATRATSAFGVQTDASWRINDRHTLRVGVMAQLATTGAKTLSSVLPVDASGAPTTGLPRTIDDGFHRTGTRYGVYLQDEWRLLPTLTVNAGARFDAVNEFTRESQVSPRFNLVWRATKSTILHAGYARYFAPPPFELVTASALAKFLGTTAAPATTQNDPPRAERADYFDVGISQTILPGLTLGVDVYYKIARNLLDEGQFGAPVILTAFNYARGTQQGVTFSVSYDRGPLSLYGNLARSRAMGKDITSAQFNFDPADLAYISANQVHLDHDQTWTGSAGAAYTLNGETDGATRFAVDVIVQSGLRATVTGGAPNGIALPGRAVVNLSVVQKLSAQTELRLDVLNAGDSRYLIRDGSGVGVGAPQYGLRRTVLAGMKHRF